MHYSATQTNQSHENNKINIDMQGGGGEKIKPKLKGSLKLIFLSKKRTF